MNNGNEQSNNPPMQPVDLNEAPHARFKALRNIGVAVGLFVLPSCTELPVGVPAAAVEAPAPAQPTPIAETTIVETTVKARIPVETWAFCGMSPSDPTAQRAANSMAQDSGIDSTMGPCLPYTNYNQADTGTRYDTPENYHALIDINAKAGMKTIVYDARLWSDDPTVRKTAIDSWTNVKDKIRFFDMGDEFPSNDPVLWSILVKRWNIMMDEVMPATGVAPYTNFTPADLPAALRDLKVIGTADIPLSFDAYGTPLPTVNEYAPKVAELACALNVLTHAIYYPTTESVTTMARSLIVAGCKKLLVFGGHVPYGTDFFGTASLVDANGDPTSLAPAVLAGATK